jgi:hypothetical protein
MTRAPEIEDLMGLDALTAACRHIRRQFRINMTRDEAKANLDARAIIWNCSNKILQQCGAGVTREEVEGALIIERELGERYPTAEMLWRVKA